MSFLSKAFGIGLATWAVAQVMRRAQNSKRERQPEAVTRWEGEGGSIPDVETKTPATRHAGIATRL